nr:hypothetical protein Itr_chr03CG06850 [Ipomoea trifida]
MFDRADRHFVSIFAANRSEATADGANVQPPPPFLCRSCHPTPPPSLSRPSPARVVSLATATTLELPIPPHYR